jgi:hypothetical protein
MRRNVLTTT